MPDETTLQTLLDKISELEKTIKDIQEVNEKLTKDNNEIKIFNRTLLDRQPTKTQPVPNDSSKEALEKFLKGD